MDFDIGTILGGLAIAMFAIDRIIQWLKQNDMPGSWDETLIETYQKVEEVAQLLGIDSDDLAERGKKRLAEKYGRK